MLVSFLQTFQLQEMKIRQNQKCIFLISRPKMFVLILEDVFFPACEPMQKTQVVVTDIKSLNALNVCIYVLCCHKQLKMFLSVISGNCNLTYIV